MSTTDTPGKALAPPRSAGDMLALAREFLSRKGLPQARLEAELLVAHSLGLDRLHLYLGLDRPVTAAEVERARELLVRRGRREPTAYITGRREFYGRSFAVSREVLIPRPESELLVDLGRQLCASREGLRVGDVGTGSGCLAITLALELARARVSGVDVSAGALACARANAEELGAAVELVAGDGAAGLGAAADFDLIVSNPPYVRPDELEGLEPEVRDWEPRQALLLPEGDPGYWLRRLLDESPPRMAAAGRLLIELGAAQAKLALELAAERGLRARLQRDLAGLPRVLEVRT